MSEFDEKIIERLKRLEREVERLQVKEKPDKTGWIPVSDTWTYTSATTITVPSGATSIYSVGDKFKLTANSVVLQGYIVKVEDTKLTVVGNPLTNHTFSNISYSKSATPQGFPHWFDWTPTLNSGDADLQTCNFAKFCIKGREFTVLFYGSGNVTGAGVIKISSPLIQTGSISGMWIGYNGATSTIGMVIHQSDGCFDIYKDGWYGNWAGGESNVTIRFTFVSQI